jgi:serine/threonine-protein kinase
MSLGTPHYMSPEQAMGEREITARSDVYALGAVLYEMLSGDPPFTGSTAQAIVARVVTESPRPLSAQRHTVPRHVEAAVMTALEKLPADRFATAAEFAEALQNRTYASTLSLEAAVPPSARAGSRRRPGAALLALAAVALVSTVAALWGWLRPAPAPPLSQFALSLPSAQGLQPPLPTGGGRLAISPDGRRLVYSGPADGGSRLWVRPLDQLSATPIAGTEGASNPFFSPDGQRVGFIKGGNTVRIASFEGAPTVTLTDKANSTGGDWGDDGYVYFEVDSGLARMRPSGGAVEPVFTFSAAQNVVGTEWPDVLPGSQGLIFRMRHAGQSAADWDIMAAALPHGSPHVLTHGVFARYSPSGHLLVVTAEGKLVAIPFDSKKLALTGAPVALIEGIGVRGGGFNVDLSLSPAGTLVYTTGGALVSRRAYWVGRDGVASPADPAWDPQGVINEIALSPDGKQVAVGLVRNGRSDIWVKQLPNGPFSRITFGDTSAVRPAWSPDGREVYYASDRTGSGVGSPYAHRADGTGTARPLTSSRRDFGQIVPSRDGRWLVLRTSASDPGSGDILGQRTGDTALVPLVATPAAELFPALSPDGKWLAYTSNESGTFEVYVRPFPATGSARWQVSTAGGTEPAWGHSGHELFYLNGKLELVSAEVRPGPQFSVGAQHTLFSAASYVRSGMHSYAVSPDDRRFLLVREGDATQQGDLVLAEHWLQELRGRMGK